MRRLILCIFPTCLLATSLPVLAQEGGQITSGAEIAALRAELEAMRAEYEARIELLENRLSAAEQKVADVEKAGADRASAESMAQAAPAFGAPAQDRGSSAFNPDIGVIFQGQAWNYKKNPDDHSIPGFPLGGEAGPLPEGLSVGETELSFSANVDDKFTAWLTMPVAIENGEGSIGVEEAWIQTLGLPAGLSVRLGRHFADIGYLNTKHAHTWDFIDEPLPYQAFLGGQYVDDGVQLRWLAPTDLYLELVGEVDRGSNYPAGGARHSGYGSWALHARLGGDIGYSNSWQTGLSWLRTDAGSRQSGSESEPLLFTGQTDLGMAEFVWKWAPNGNIRQRNFKFQAEYLWRKEDGSYQLHDGANLPYDNKQQGWYMQAVLQPFPRWRFGLRWDQLTGNDPGPVFAGTNLMPLGSDPRRYSIMSDWSNSEFSRLRLQYTRDESGPENDDQWGLQYIFSIGAHGAHTF